MSSLHPVTFMFSFSLSHSISQFPLWFCLSHPSYELIHFNIFVNFSNFLVIYLHYHQKAYFVLSTYLNLLRCKLNIWSIFKNISCVLKKNKASLLAQLVKNPPANAGDARDPGSIPGPSLGRSPEEGNGSYSRILAWGISWTEEPGGLQSMGSI